MHWEINEKQLYNYEETSASTQLHKLLNIEVSHSDLLRLQTQHHIHVHSPYTPNRIITCILCTSRIKKRANYDARGSMRKWKLYSNWRAICSKVSLVRLHVMPMEHIKHIHICIPHGISITWYLASSQMNYDIWQVNVAEEQANPPARGGPSRLPMPLMMVTMLNALVRFSIPR